MMSNPDVAALGWQLMHDVREIDLACQRTIHGIEGGLCNIKSQFVADVADKLVSAPPRAVKEEDAITWLLAERLQGRGISSTPWLNYPSSHKTCDLVVRIRPSLTLWLELKLAWKCWANCNGTLGKSSAYIPYLCGSKHKTHSAADDFMKLAALAPADATRGFLLIGFDSVSSPMQTEVNALAKLVAASGWIGDHAIWHDRRNPQCRIGCWFWHRGPAV